MALTTGVWLFLVGLLTAALSRILADEIGAWSTWIIRSLIKLAVAWSPENQRERFAEEWHSHINEVPGTIGKVFAAAGFLLAAQSMARTAKRNRIIEGWLHRVAQLEAPWSKAIILVNAIEDSKLLTSEENIRDLQRLSSALGEHKELLAQLVTTLKAASIPDNFIVRLRYRHKIKLIQQRFDQMSRSTQQVGEATGQIVNAIRQKASAAQERTITSE
jgi:hypothetical protein